MWSEAEATREISQLVEILRKPAIRYRTCVLRSIDLRALGAIAQLLGRDLDGRVLDALDIPSLADGEATVRPMEAVAWIACNVQDEGAYCVSHLDPIIATWNAASDRSVLWEQLALL